MNLSISVLPIILPFLFLVILKMPAKKGMTLSFLIVLIMAYFFWDMNEITLLASIIQGLHKAFGILIILFGAIIMMNILQMNGAIDRINLWFDHLTQDMRIQAILIAFLFGGLIEGVAGFGTPAVVVAPLLVALGYKPITAATLALVSNSVPVPFAAVGTPIKIGLANISTSTEFFNNIARTITSIEFLAGSFMPTIIVFMLLFFFAENSKKKDYIEILPWTLFIGFSYALIAKLVAITLGYEFVTIITVLVMLVVAIMSIKFKFLIPKHTWQNANEREDDLTHSDMSIIQAWLPYAIVILLLVMSRVIKPIQTFFQTTVDLSISNILGINGISSSLQLLYSPGFILIIVAIFSVFIQKASTKNIKVASLLSLNTVKGAALALIPTLSMVQIFSNSGLNSSDLVSMPVYLATFLGDNFSGIWVFLASYIGELGSFITGSATVSTLTFSPIQYQIALDYGLNVIVILSLQLLGGAAGNMICVHNVVSVSTVVGIEGQEGNIIKKTLLPAILYGFLVGLSAFLLF
ncbi:MAG: L-lactate permease [Candidatus Izimaplasma sp.]|nr:L-lactate permease [Candidatus Izimaplasma bacterium]